jgi:hypothetical protein
LHVLGMPPAFVLSQDQTLRLTWPAHPKAHRPINVGPCTNTSSLLHETTSLPLAPFQSQASVIASEHAFGKNPQTSATTANTQDPPPAYPFSSHHNVKQQNGACLDPSRTRPDRPRAPQRSGLIRAARTHCQRLLPRQDRRRIDLRDAVATWPQALPQSRKKGCGN